MVRKTPSPGLAHYAVETFLRTVGTFASALIDCASKLFAPDEPALSVDRLDLLTVAD